MYLLRNAWKRGCTVVAFDIYWLASLFRMRARSKSRLPGNAWKAVAAAEAAVTVPAVPRSPAYLNCPLFFVKRYSRLLHQRSPLFPARKKKNLSNALTPIRSFAALPRSQSSGNLLPLETTVFALLAIVDELPISKQILLSNLQYFSLS